MAQFDVHANRGARRADVPYVVLVQSALFDSYRRRVVVPLVRGGVLPAGIQSAGSRMHPVFDIHGQRVVLQPLIVLMHGDCKVSTKNLARQIGAKSVEPCKPEVANRHSGYLVGGTSPFGTRKTMPVYIEASVLELPRIAINGGRRGFLVQIDPQVCVQLLGATPVHCALAE